MIDPKTGAAVTDPQKSGAALLLPMGGYKGAGLALILGMLVYSLNGALFGARLRRLQRQAGPGFLQYRPICAGARPQPLPAARPVQGGSRSPHPQGE